MPRLVGGGEDHSLSLPDDNKHFVQSYHHGWTMLVPALDQARQLLRDAEERQDPGAISRARSHILGIENNRTKMLETVYREICYLHHQEQEAAIALALDRYWASLSQLDAFHGFRNLHRLLPDPSVEQLELYADGSMHAGPLPRVPSSSAVASLNPSRAPSPHNSLAKFLTRRQRLRYEGTS